VKCPRGEWVRGLLSPPPPNPLSLSLSLLSSSRFLFAPTTPREHVYRQAHLKEVLKVIPQYGIAHPYCA